MVLGYTVHWIVEKTEDNLYPSTYKEINVDKIKIRSVFIHCDCGTSLLDSELEPYCHNCGKHFSECKYNPKNDSIIYECPYCKRSASTRYKFCEYCGKDIGEIGQRINNSLGDKSLIYK